LNKFDFYFYTSDDGSKSMKQSIQHEKLLFESFFLSNFLHLLIVDGDDDDDDSESVLSFLRIVILLVNDVVAVVDERRSKFNETKQILS
jgi:hypothetical protein